MMPQTSKTQMFHRFIGLLVYACILNSNSKRSTPVTNRLELQYIRCLCVLLLLFVLLQATSDGARRPGYEASMYACLSAQAFIACYIISYLLLVM